MTIDKWDLFAICESILFVSDKPVTVEQIVTVLEREHEEALEREQDQEDERARLDRIAGTQVRDAAFDTSLRSATAAEQMQSDVGVSATLDGFEALPAQGEPATDTEQAATEQVATEQAATEQVATEQAATEQVATAERVATADQVATAEQATASEEVAAEQQAARETYSPEQVRQRMLHKELTRLVEDAFGALMIVYADPGRRTGRGLQLVNVAGAYQLRTNTECAAFVRHHLQVKPTKLSRAQVETLAIIAYRQPVTRPEIEHIRGVDCGAGLKILLDRRLIRILGKKEEVGRPLLYGTTKEFLEFFNLASLLELPTLREFQELSDEHKKKVEEELEADAPLGDLRQLAEGQPTFVVDDTALLADVDQALQGAKQTVSRVAELTGMKATDEDSPKADA